MMRGITGIGAGNGPFMSIHDGFAGLSTWAGFLSGSDRIVLDTHPYFAFDGSGSTAPIDTGTGINAGGTWPAAACNRWASELNARYVGKKPYCSAGADEDFFFFFNRTVGLHLALHTLESLVTGLMIAAFTFWEWGLQPPMEETVTIGQILQLGRLPRKLVCKSSPWQVWIHSGIGSSGHGRFVSLPRRLFDSWNLP